MKLYRQLALALLLLCPLRLEASLEKAVEGMIDRAADRSVHLNTFQAERYRAGMDLSRWNHHGGSQNIPVIAEAAAGNYAWIAALARLEREEGLFGTELGSPGFYFSAVVEAKLVALRDARRAGRLDLAEDIRQNLRAIWAMESLVAVDTPRTSVWANASGQILEGPGDAADYTGLSCAVAGNRWNGKFPRWLNSDAHGRMLSWALDWPRQDRKPGGVMRNPKPGRGNVIGFLGGVDRYEDTVAAEIFGLTEDERELLRRVVRGDVEAARMAAGWLAEYGTLAKWTWRLRRTTEGTEVIFFGPWPNPNKPPHAATSITNSGEWRTIRPSYFERRRGGVWDFNVRVEDGEIIARVREGLGVEVRMPELAGALLWEVVMQGQTVTFQTAGEGPQRGGRIDHERHERFPEFRHP